MKEFSSFRTQEEHVLDLQLLACRKKYRGRGLGRHLIKVNIRLIILNLAFFFFQLLMNRDYIGEYDAVITASDQSAIDFYRKFGFTDDCNYLEQIQVDLFYFEAS